MTEFHNICVNEHFYMLGMEETLQRILPDFEGNNYIILSGEFFGQKGTCPMSAIVRRAETPTLTNMVQHG